MISQRGELAGQWKVMLEMYGNGRVKEVGARAKALLEQAGDMELRQFDPQVKLAFKDRKQAKKE